MPQAIVDKFAAQVAGEEGNYDFMYLCSRSQVTVGMGKMLPDEKAAKTIKFSFLTSGKLATAEDISTAYQAISAKSPKGQSQNYKATYFAQFTQIRLAKGEAERLTSEHSSNDYTALVKGFPDFDSFPEEAQLAILDWRYNVGSLGAHHSKLMEHITKRDWLAAAEYSRTKSISEKRAAYRVARFTSAASGQNLASTKQGVTNVLNRETAQAKNVTVISYAKGANGPAIQAIQQALNRAYAILPLKSDGQFGLATEARVRQFQLQTNLPVNGVVGASTQKALGLVVPANMCVAANPPARNMSRKPGG